MHSSEYRSSIDITAVTTLDCRGISLPCATIRQGVPAVMGVLNITPDSFSDGGRYMDIDAALRRVEEMVDEGAAVVDVGGESTRPRGAAYGEGALTVDSEEERRRVVPVIKAIVERFPRLVISVDTYKSDVANDALEAGAHIVNDVTGLRQSPAAAEEAARVGAAMVVMHALGRPGELPHEYSYDDVRREVCGSLARSVAVARAAGVRSVAVDPGFGFGKTPSDNLRLLNQMDCLKELGCPILVGISRKSTIGSILERDNMPRAADDRLFGTLGATAIAVLNGASIVRTHDVGPTIDFLRLMHATLTA